ncbi:MULTISPECIES: Nif11-like leader peptide family natural product precursor [unclassified Anabaena]|uniref:Nif11-like leader peptide family natural product precursor n=1 Tax=unclassified Anabaena TaxID=2619674 RepID=UPI0039C5F946
MAQQKTAQLLHAVKEDQALKARLKATNNAEAFIEIARECGYDFTVEELEDEISKLSDEDLAAIVNPGWGNRRHIYPR